MAQLQPCPRLGALASSSTLAPIEFAASSVLLAIFDRPVKQACDEAYATQQFQAHCHLRGRCSLTQLGMEGSDQNGATERLVRWLID